MTKLAKNAQVFFSNSIRNMRVIEVGEGRQRTAEENYDMTSRN